MKIEMKKFFSIVIPFYFKDNSSLKQLYRCIDSIKKQTFKDYEVIISTQNIFERLNKDINSRFDGVTVLNAENVKGFIQGNVNNAIFHASGKWIKILFSDDFFFDKYSLENIYFQIMKNSFNWGVMSSLHIDNADSKIFKPIIPYFQKNILEVNTIGSPSAIVFKNDKTLLFDQKTWMRLDVDYYYSLHKKFGNPFYIKNVFVVNEIHKNQFSSLLINKNISTKFKLKKELEYLSKKHRYKCKSFLKLFLIIFFVKVERIFLAIYFNFYSKRILKIKNYSLVKSLYSILKLYILFPL